MNEKWRLMSIYLSLFRMAGGASLFAVMAQIGRLDRCTVALWGRIAG